MYRQSIILSGVLLFMTFASVARDANGPIGESFKPVLHHQITLNCSQGSIVDTLVLTRTEAEAVFLQQNLLLLAEKLNISQADAMVMQARLWPNPTITIDQVNFWATPAQLAGGEGLPPIVNDWGRNQQIGIQIEQLILMAGKRRKLIAMEQVSSDIAKEYLEDLLRNLKIEFRVTLTQLQYQQLYFTVFLKQLASVQSLLQAYKNQLDQGNIGKGEYLRLKAQELQLTKEINDLNKETNDIQKGLKILMNLPSQTFLVIAPEGFVPDPEKLDNINLTDLYSLAVDNRPDLKAARLEASWFYKLYDFQRAHRMPDLNFIGCYDRGGNFMLNFIGFGIAMDIPVFNRNQGNIKYAQIGIERSKILLEERITRVHAEVMKAYQDFLANRILFESIEAGYEEDLDRLLESYTKNFRERNIRMLEYLDFLNAYLENKKIILDAKKELNNSVEEMQYITGKEIE